MGRFSLGRDEDNLGYVLDEQGQGDPHWLEKFAARHLCSRGVLDGLIHSGHIRPESYGADLLETSEYMLTGGENGYLLRNSREFVHEYTAQEQNGMTMQ